MIGTDVIVARQVSILFDNMYLFIITGPLTNVCQPLVILGRHSIWLITANVLMSTLSFTLAF
jgi:hypothetical protein